MEQLQQGFGYTREYSGQLPTQRTDGTPYAHGPEDYFLCYISDDPKNLTKNPGIAVELVNGKFDRVEDVDAMTPGIFYVTFSTVDVTPTGEKLEGPVHPTPLVFEVLAPLAPPLYPSNLG